MVVLKLGVGALALLTLASCWSPVFNVDVSLAALTTSKLSLDAQFSANLNSGSTTTTFVAVPTPARPPAEVFVASLSQSNLGVTTFLSSGGWSGASSTGADYDSAVSDATLVTLVAGLDGASLATFEPTVSGGVVSFLAGSTSTTYPTSNTQHVIGGTAYPTSATDVLYYTLSTINAGVSVDSFDSSSSKALGSNTVNVAAGAYSDSTSYGWFAFDPNNLVGYLTHSSKDSSGKYTTDKIQFTSTTATPDGSWTRTDHVVAFLTSGQLLTRDGGFYDVCDSGGSVQFSFSAGSLSFAGEFYDTATSAYRCWFTEVLANDGSNSSGGYTVSVYSIPTSQLGSLK